MTSQCPPPYAGARAHAGAQALDSRPAAPAGRRPGDQGRAGERAAAGSGRSAVAQ
ncbi:hypothetical protein [Streptomyces odontomachi]|uniref:hypothetical protein n=1 Tax=Streptomyces odontomachi TaxID=2944940 RepID=UPI00210A3FF6|nr:hypothetical protein [Streptomyces sp. ODS25]